MADGTYTVELRFGLGEWHRVPGTGWYRDEAAALRQMDMAFDRIRELNPNRRFDVRVMLGGDVEIETRHRPTRSSTTLRSPTRS